MHACVCEYVCAFRKNKKETIVKKDEEMMMRKLRERFRILGIKGHSKGINNIILYNYSCHATFKHSNATTVRITQQITSVTVKVWQAG